MNIFPWQSTWQAERFDLTRAQAWLFHGPPGIGKKNWVEHLLHQHVCQSDTKQPCYQCSACQCFTAKTHPDVIWGENDFIGQKYGIDAVRAWQEKIIQTPAKGAYTWVYIPYLEKMTTSASHALLKMLEEPPRHVIWVNVSDTPYGLLDTIRSRLLHFSLPQVNKNLALTWLQQETHQTKAWCEWALTWHHGSPRLALSWLNSLNDNQIMVKSMLEDINAWHNNNKTIVDLVKTWQSKDNFMPLLWHWWQGFFMYRTQPDCLGLFPSQQKYYAHYIQEAVSYRDAFLLQQTLYQQTTPGLLLGWFGRWAKLIAFT